MLASLAFAGGVTLLAACSDDTTAGTTPGTFVSEGGASGQDGGTPGAQDAQVDSAAAASTCAITRAYVLACNADEPDAGDPLNCGAAKFDAWCDANDKAINSESYRRAQAQCLTGANPRCESNGRKDCEYKTYAAATPTAAQKQLVAAFCQLCEPTDAVDCATRKTAYDPVKGPSKVDDVFVAAWELNDTLADAIRAKCTGGTVDGGSGADVGACTKQFGICAGDIYIDALPDCP